MPRSARLLRFLMMIGLAIYVLSTVLIDRPEGGFSLLYEGWIYEGTLVLATLVCASRALGSPRARRGWVLVALGIGTWTVGDIIWTVQTARHSIPQSSPALPDVFYLLAYPLIVCGVFLIGRARVASWDLSRCLDGLVSGLALAALVCTMSFGSISSAALAKGSVTVNLTYPLLDLVLLVAVIWLSAAATWRSDRAWTSLGLGVVCWSLADTVFLFQDATREYIAGTWLDSAWLLGAVMMAASAWSSERRGGPERPSNGRHFVLIPGAAMTVAMGLLVVATTHHLPTMAIGLAGSTALLGTARLIFTLHEVRSLAESRLEARRDDLTGLGNRRALREALSRHLSAAVEDPEPLALLLMDLDRFKQVNDTLGHQVGDQLLVELAQRIRRSAPDAVSIVRLGGDEFAIAVRGGRHEAELTAERILGTFAEPVVIDTHTTYTDASIGIALAPEHGSSSDSLLQLADIAMYEAKRSRSRYHVYDADGHDELVARVSMCTDLRSAIRRRELSVHYQPQIDLRTGAVIGVEALVRWRHPDRGLLTPKDFLALAEESGQLVQVTSFVVETAAQQYADWARSGITVPIAINVTQADLFGTELTEQLRASFAAHALPTSALRIEVTEQMVLGDTRRVIAVLESLRAFGIRVALDDFGTGYSSLSHLRNLPIDEVKIDRTFVADMIGDPMARAIVRSTIELARARGLHVVAEGIEHIEIARLLKQFDCDHAQGFLWCDARNGRDTAAWIHDRHRWLAQANAAAAVPPEPTVDTLDLRTLNRSAV